MKQSALAGLSVLTPAVLSWAASKDRLTILSSIGLDSLHPYAHSSSPQYGIWQHMIEPLVEVDYAEKHYYGVLAESWEFQGRKWIFHLRKKTRFHDGMLFTATDVIHSINGIKNDKQSLQKENFRDVPRCRRWTIKPSSLPLKCRTRSFSIVCKTVL